MRILTALVLLASACSDETTNYYMTPADSGGTAALGGSAESSGGESASAGSSGGGGASGATSQGGSAPGGGESSVPVSTGGAGGSDGGAAPVDLCPLPPWPQQWLRLCEDYPECSASVRVDQCTDFVVQPEGCSVLMAAKGGDIDGQGTCAVIVPNADRNEDFHVAVTWDMTIAAQHRWLALRFTGRSDECTPDVAASYCTLP